MQRILAWREQIAQVGDIDRDVRVRLAEALAVTQPEKIGKARSTPRVRSGTVLVREHGGVHHRVTALDDGFAWNGATYGSLSEIARVITGTNWNGYRFFGLASPNRTEGGGGAGVRKSVGGGRDSTPKPLSPARPDKGRGQTPREAGPRTAPASVRLAEVAS